MNGGFGESPDPVVLECALDAGARPFVGGLPRLPLTVHRSLLFCSPFTVYPPNTRSTSANPNTVADMTAFMVKKAALSRDRSSARTRRCS